MGIWGEKIGLIMVVVMRLKGVGDLVVVGMEDNLECWEIFGGVNRVGIWSGLG